MVIKMNKKGGLMDSVTFVFFVASIGVIFLLFLFPYGINIWQYSGQALGQLTGQMITGVDHAVDSVGTTLWCYITGC